MDEHPDSHLMKAKGGDQGSLDHLHSILLSTLHAEAPTVVKGVGCGIHCAEDVAQEAFMTAVRQWANFRGTSFSTCLCWAVTILRGTALDHARSKRCKRFRQAANVSACGDVEAPPTAELAELDDDELTKVREIRSALESIPPDQAQAFRLRFFGTPDRGSEGMTFQQIADHTGVALGTAQTRVRRAIERIKQMTAIDFPDETAFRSGESNGPMRCGRSTAPAGVSAGRQA